MFVFHGVEVLVIALTAHVWQMYGKSAHTASYPGAVMRLRVIQHDSAS